MRARRLKASGDTLPSDAEPLMCLTLKYSVHICQYYIYYLCGNTTLPPMRTPFTSSCRALLAPQMRRTSNLSNLNALVDKEVREGRDLAE